MFNASLPDGGGNIEDVSIFEVMGRAQPEYVGHTFANPNSNGEFDLWIYNGKSSSPSEATGNYLFKKWRLILVNNAKEEKSHWINRRETFNDLFTQLWKSHQASEDPIHSDTNY